MLEDESLCKQDCFEALVSMMAENRRLATLADSSESMDANQRAATVAWYDHEYDELAEVGRQLGLGVIDVATVTNRYPRIKDFQ